MQVFQPCLLVLFFSLVFNFSNASECNSSNVVSTLRVAQYDIGFDHFKTIQEAINSIPNNNNLWVKILVWPGVYREVVQIPKYKDCIVLQGTNAINTTIVSDVHGGPNPSATFISYGDNFQARAIGFVNSAGRVGPALAIGVFGDKSAFYECSFIGYQDTLLDAQGRHYFKSCYIEGVADFIWGSGQSVYEDCKINVTGGGYITAQGRDSSSSPSGFLFLDGSVSGSGKTYLGRAYGAYSRVIYKGTSLSEIINPLGWDIWEQAGHERDIVYYEVNCTGLGADKAGRVQWAKSKEPTTAELTQFTVSGFVDQDGWIAEQAS